MAALVLVLVLSRRDCTAILALAEAMTRPTLQSTRQKCRRVTRRCGGGSLLVLCHRKAN